MIITQPALVCLQAATEQAVARGATLGAPARRLWRRSGRHQVGPAGAHARLPYGLPLAETSLLPEARPEREAIAAPRPA